MDFNLTKFDASYFCQNYTHHLDTKLSNNNKKGNDFLGFDTNIKQNKCRKNMGRYENIE